MLSQPVAVVLFVSAALVALVVVVAAAATTTLTVAASIDGRHHHDRHGVTECGSLQVGAHLKRLSRASLCLSASLSTLILSMAARWRPTRTVLDSSCDMANQRRQAPPAPRRQRC